MYVLEIETNYETKKIENPKEARIVDKIFSDALQVMDESGVWHTVSNRLMRKSIRETVVKQINDAIAAKKENISLDI